MCELQVIPYPAVQKFAKGPGAPECHLPFSPGTELFTPVLLPTGTTNSNFRSVYGKNCGKPSWSLCKHIAEPKTNDASASLWPEARLRCVCRMIFEFFTIRRGTFGSGPCHLFNLPN